VRQVLAPLFAAAAAGDGDATLRGPLHRLSEGLGVVAHDDADAIPPGLRGRLKAIEARAGRYALFVPALLKPRATALRACLWALRHGVTLPSLPAAGVVAMAPPAGWPEGFAPAMGWVAAGPVLLRLDVAERIAAELAFASRQRPVPVPAGLASRLGVKGEMLPAVLRRLGFRLLPAAPMPDGQFGPPAPAMLAPIRRRRWEPEGGAAEPATREAGPFAALATLRRR
jgi:ATP-dependent RNA helicase SUPV3L1/SUV3